MVRKIAAAREQRHYCYQLVVNERNLGYCGGANQGIRQTRGRYNVLLNPDVHSGCHVSRTIINIVWHSTNIVEFSQGNSCVMTGKPWTSTGQFYEKNFSYLFERGKTNRNRGHNWINPEFVFSSCGAVAWYRRAMLDDSTRWRIFDESYFAFYEDLDKRLAWRN
jgi:GT2 family glycosyltransferase